MMDIYESYPCAYRLLIFFVCIGQETWKLITPPTCPHFPYRTQRYLLTELILCWNHNTSCSLYWANIELFGEISKITAFGKSRGKRRKSLKSRLPWFRDFLLSLFIPHLYSTSRLKWGSSDDGLNFWHQGRQMPVIQRCKNTDEKFNPLSRVHHCHRQPTGRRQTELRWHKADAI